MKCVARVDDVPCDRPDAADTAFGPLCPSHHHTALQVFKLPDREEMGREIVRDAQVRVTLFTAPAS